VDFSELLLYSVLYTDLGERRAAVRTSKARWEKPNSSFSKQE